MDPAQRRVWLRRAVAWGLTGLVILFLLTRYSITDVSAAVARGNWLGVIPFVVAATVWSLFFMSSADWSVFSVSLGKMPPLAVLRGKAGTSVIQAVNHSVGQGAYAVWVGRRSGAGLQKTVGVMGFVVICDLIALFAVATVAVWSLDEASALQLPRADVVLWVAPLICAGLIGFAFIAPRILPRLIKRAELLDPWKRFSVARFTVTVGLRAGSLLGIMFSTWGAMTTFGIDVPLGACMTALPVIFLAGALPVNVLGFGPVQLAWIAAFETWAKGEEILAFQLLFYMMLVAALVLRGVAFLPSVLREIERGKANDSDGDSDNDSDSDSDQ